jgi:hypothetical protein
MAVKRLTGDLAQTTVGINPGIAIPGASQVLGLTDWTMTIKQKAIDASTTDDDAWEDWLPSMSSWTAKAKYVYLMGDPSQLTNIIQASIGTGRRTSSQWNFFLDSTSGDDSFSGQAFISGLGISSIIGRTVTMDVTLQGRGPLNLRNQAGFLAALVPATAHAHKNYSASLGGYNWGAIWSDFVAVSTLPSDAAIVAIWPVIIASVVKEVTIQWLAYGSVGDAGIGGGLLGTPFDNPPAPQTSFTSTEFTSLLSIGTHLSDLTGKQIGMVIDSSVVNAGPLVDDMIVTGCGYAIYYTSATPLIDPRMPAPYTVPSGQGVTWALPLSVALLGPPAANGTVVASSSLVVE